MNFLKRKINFSQFIAELIASQFDFLETNFNKLVVLADEFKVLTEKDREVFLEKAHELIISDIMISCNQHFKNLSSDEIGRIVGSIYVQYLTEYKNIPKTLAWETSEKVSELLNLICKAEEEYEEKNEYYKKIGYTSSFKIDNNIDKQKYYLCSGFSDYYAGEDMKSENWEGKHFAAFKLAKGLVKSDIVAQSLKHYSIVVQ
jgi:hypothetical protein